MILRNRNIVVLVILLVATLQVSAQKNFKFNRRIDSVLTARYWKADIDTNYITRPHTKWTVIGRINVSGARIQAEGKKDERHFESDLKADYKSTLSLGISYLGMSLNLALNPAKLLGKYRDFELAIRSYGKRVGFEIAYQDASNFKGWHNEEGSQQEIITTEDMFKLRTLNVNVYYVFNDRRFSYPAAFIHSYIQRRSAGSFLLAMSGQGQHGRVKGYVSEEGTEIPPMDFKMTNIGIGAGYGYNYVPSHGWLLHISSLPTFIVYSNTSLKKGDTKIPLRYHFPEVIITARGAIVKQIGNNKVAGFSMVYNFVNIGDEKKFALKNQKWLIRFYFGFRL